MGLLNEVVNCALMSVGHPDRRRIERRFCSRYCLEIIDAVLERLGARRLLHRDDLE